MFPKKITFTPQDIYFLVWIIPLSAPYFFVNNSIISPVSSQTESLVFFNIGIFYIFGFIFWLSGVRGGTDRVRLAVRKINFQKFRYKINLLFKLWCVIYLINIIGSGGFPLLWVALGDSKTYVDFGLPTLGGFGNLLRAFILSACYLIYFESQLPKRTKNRYAAVGIFLVLSSFLLETGRGNGVVLVLHPIALYLLLNKFSFSRLIKLFIAVMSFLIMLGSIQLIRYADGLDKLQIYAENSGFVDLNILELLLVPSVMYVSIPIVNTDLNVQIAPPLQFSPYYSLQGFVPTVIRERIFESGDYGELVNDANNVSSFYIPFIRDFGVFGAATVVSFLTLIVAYCYAMASQGRIHYVLIYPALFMSITLSFFSLFFTSLVVLLYPFLAIWSLRGCIK